MKKESMKDNDVVTNLMASGDDKINEMSSVLEWDYSSVRPKKSHKKIKKLMDFVKEYMQFKELKDDIENLSQKKNQLTDQNDRLDEENKNLAKKKNSCEKKIETLEFDIIEKQENHEKLVKDSESLHSNIKTLKSQNEELEKENKNLQDKKNYAISKMNEAKKNMDGYNEEKINTEKEINKLLENKTFYSETLSGHKKETKKLLWVNMFGGVILLGIIGWLLYFTLDFYKTAIEQIIKQDAYVKTLFLFIARGGGGVLLYFIFRFLFNLLNRILTEMYSIFKGIRDIETNLILAREITLSTEKNVSFENKEERRNYLSFLKLSVLKSYFINLSSLKTSLHIKDDKWKQISEEESTKIINSKPIDKIKQ